MVLARWLRDDIGPLALTALRFTVATTFFGILLRGRASSLAIYRAIRYAVDNGARVINISLGGKGKKPDKWKQVFGPSGEYAEYNHICRIENELLQKGREWTVRITAKSKSGKTKTASLFVKKKKN